MPLGKTLGRRLFKALIPAVAFWLFFASAAAAGIQPAGPAVAGKPLQVRISSADQAAGSEAVSLNVSKVGAWSPWLYASYLPEGRVLSLPLHRAAGSKAVTLTFWDAGRYRIDIGTGQSLEVAVAAPAAQIMTTAAAFLVLAGLGFWCGWAAGGLKRPGAGALAAGLVLLLSTGAAAHGGASRATVIGLSGGEPLLSGQLSRVVLPAGAPGQASPGAAREAWLTLEHEEDGIRLLEASVILSGEALELSYAFPEGADYHLTLTPRAGEGSAELNQAAQRDFLISVEPKHPSVMLQARAYSLMAAVYLAGFLAGWLALKSRTGDPAQRRRA